MSFKSRLKKLEDQARISLPKEKPWYACYEKDGVFPCDNCPLGEKKDQVRCMKITVARAPISPLEKNA